MSPTLTIDGAAYEVLVPFDTTFDGERMSFTAESQRRVVILCEHCRNFRLDPIVLSTVEELVESGWIRPAAVEATA